ncbi:T9SS type B sorting domain-containing protein [Flavobacterium silvaticum]|uniref:T9SS type B sorting domain-containing protein n=1 Tax=Flavobacterium silvaticum TaxID=1852020 RepID=A0A972JIN9_9FLAO|nr:T9SS type B sorting domain-containing protein [Flavobacterium silvaticum]NMH29250.1 T9SS type B sorting domain-containing protein [Flavobacterium silvaticum]
MKRILLFICLCLWLSGQAQFSKTHYIPPLSGSDNVLSEEQFLYVSTPSVATVNFRVIYLGGEIIEGTVSRDTPYVLSMGFVIENNSQILVPSFGADQILSNKGIIIEADDLVYASIRLIAGNGNQAGELVSKGLAALGTDFRVGAMVNTLMDDYSDVHYTFASVLATENNTVVTFSDIKPGASLVNSSTGSNTFSITLNSGESYVAACEGPLNVNRDALIGMHIQSDKPIAVNCGSFGGTNGELFNLDLGFDQIVSSERTGKDYIFIKSTGSDPVEKILLVANENNTEIFLSGNATPSYTMNAGDYITIDGLQFGPNGNLFVHSSKNVFAYQSIGDDGRPDQANQELFFVPPLSCETPRIIDNIPLIDLVGNRQFTGRITLVTEAGSTLTFNNDGTDYTLGGLIGIGATVSGPLSVEGNAGFETYVISGLSGNVAVTSTTQLYLASYGSSDAATFGGYYSGFTFRPEISQESLDTSSENCLPNLQLGVNEVTGFDTYQWFFNELAITGATQSTYVPTSPGYYYVRAAISACNTELESEKLPVSTCAPDSDADGVNDNLDLDLDNDGLLNCTESFGDANVNLATASGGTIAAGNYLNTFTLSFPSGTGTAATNPYSGYANGNFTTRTTAGEGNSSIIQFNFASPMPIMLQYPMEDMAAESFNDATEYRISVPAGQTISIDDPDHQLLIDTNCDGVFENGVLRHSSFEIRFRLNSGVPIAAGAGTFKIRSHSASQLKVTHINLSGTAANSSTLKLVATCLPKDSDADGIPDAEDLDSDNDGIMDLYEIQGGNALSVSGTDSNADGHDDAFNSITSAVDTDTDGIPDYLDLDSDNNGVYDLTESGLPIPDANADGIADGSNFGTNGLLDSIETFADSGTPVQSITDTDSDGIPDFISSDNDGDGCNDVIEAGFSDANADGFLEDVSPVTVNPKGVVTAATGYTTPNPDINIISPIDISQQPQPVNPVCEGEAAQFGITVNAGVTIQWEVSHDGINFTAATDPVLYSGSDSSQFTVLWPVFSMNGDQFRANLSRSGNACGKISSAVTLQVQTPPSIISAELIQCEPDLVPNGLTTFNLQQADAYFGSPSEPYSVRYFLDLPQAMAGTSPLNNIFNNTLNPQQLIAEVTYTNSGCRSFSNLQLTVISTPVQPLTFAPVCENQLEEDGFETFDLTSAGFGGDLSELTYFTSLSDALLELNPIASPATFTNTNPYVLQTIYVRRENTNICSDFYSFPIQVLQLPPIDGTPDLGPHIVCRNEPDVTVTLEATILDGSSPLSYTYQWTLDGQVLPGLNGPQITVSEAGLYQVAVTGNNGCTKTREFTVTASSQALIQDVAITDLSQNNTVAIVLDPASLGDYEYSIDEPNFFQASNQFSHVIPGIHTVYVKDLNGCALATQQINVLGVSPFFSPNSDGYNDTWMLKGTSNLYNANADIYIFDRFGKLIKQLAGFSAGWDGSLNGHPLPADDYWYRIVLENGRTATGHFSLVR